MIYEKKIKIKIKISARFGQFLISSWIEKGHEPSRAENLSAQAMDRATSARTHHYSNYPLNSLKNQK
jgi:hypothetical protein